jgi:hypothetical protein
VQPYTAKGVAAAEGFCFEKGTVTMETRLKLTAEDIFDIFFVTKFVQGFGLVSTSALCGILRASSIRRTKKRRPAKNHNPNLKRSMFTRVKDSSETRSVMKRGKRRRQKVDFVEPVLDIARTDLDFSDIAQHLGKELGDHQIRIVCIIKDGEQTVGLLLIFCRDDEKRIDTYKKNFEEDNKKIFLASHLHAIFSARHALKPDEDGSYFIDRDG